MEAIGRHSAREGRPSDVRYDQRWAFDHGGG